MHVLIDNFDLILDGFIKTLWLLLFSGLIAAVLGTFLVVACASPRSARCASPERRTSTSSATPLCCSSCCCSSSARPTSASPTAPADYFNFFFVSATIGLGLYAAAFVCEALRSGINSIPMGQAEAARAIGMTFGQSMTVDHPAAGLPCGHPTAHQHLHRAGQEHQRRDRGRRDRGVVRDEEAQRRARR